MHIIFICKVQHLDIWQHALNIVFDASTYKNKYNDKIYLKKSLHPEKNCLRIPKVKGISGKQILLAAKLIADYTLHNNAAIALSHFFFWQITSFKLTKSLPKDNFVFRSIKSFSTVLECPAHIKREQSNNKDLNYRWTSKQDSVVCSALVKSSHLSTGIYLQQKVMVNNWHPKTDAKIFPVRKKKNWIL